MRRSSLILVLLIIIFSSGCRTSTDVNPNPWLVAGEDRFSSSVSRSQMRALYRLSHIYKDAGLQYEYIHALTTAVELFAGDINITYELLNELIEGINVTRNLASQQRIILSQNGIDASSLTRDEDEPLDEQVEAYLNILDKLEARYDECFRILRNACWQIPYNPDLYYRTAHLQFLRAEEDGDEVKYTDAIAYLKKAIATDSSHLESYRLIAIAYERLDQKELATRFWRLFEVIYEIAPEVRGEGFITPDRESMHEEALSHLERLGALNETG
ncbi:hypothetical protein KAU08_00430 [bacterium]|nr:hypothetical protein [bacterium]